MHQMKLLIVLHFLGQTFANQLYGNTNSLQCRLSHMLLQILQEIDPRVIIYIYNETEIEDVSLEVYKAEKPVYSLNALDPDIDALNQDPLVLDENNLFVISLPSFIFFEEMVFALKNIEFWKARDRLLVVSKTGGGNFGDISKYFGLCRENWIVNVVVVFLDLERAYTYNPFTYGNSYAIEKDFSRMYPDKTVDLQGFLLNVSLFNDNVFAKKIAYNEFVGRDGFISKVILQTMNATYFYVTPNDSHPFPTAIRMLSNGLTQMFFNSKTTQSLLNKTLESAYPNGRSDMVVLVPIAGKAFKNAYSEIPGALWVTLLIMSAVLFIYIRFANTKMESTVSILFIICIILVKPVKEMRAKYFRIIFMASMAIAFYLSSNFSSSVTSVLTVPNTISGARNLKELATQSDVKIKTRRGIYKRLIEALHEEVREGIVSKIEQMEEPLDVNEIMRCSDTYYVCAKELAKYALRKNLHQKHKICHRIMDEIILRYPTSYVVSYGSPFLPRVNVIIERIMESGLEEYWERYITSRLGTRKKEKSSKITLRLVFPAFAILVTGFILSVVVFAFETLWFHFKNRQTVVKTQ